MPQTYHSGLFKITTYMNPLYRTDPGFISQWKLDDITSGSGLDSQNSNHLVASGSPTQIAGYQLSSGVQFDGVDDAFYIHWASGSGIHKLMAGFTTSPALNPTYVQFAFHANIYFEDFSREQVIFSRWNDTATAADKLFQVCLTPTSGIIFRYRNTGGAIISNIFCSGSPAYPLIPSGQWVSFTFGRSGRDNSNSIIYMMVDDKLLVSTTDTVSSLDDTSSGMFCIGACNPQKSPSGFFKGRMENIYWLNGKGLSLDEHNYLASGNFPVSTRPALNIYHPHLKGVFHLDSIESGKFPPNQNSGLFTRDLKGSNHMWSSGTGSGYLTIAPGAADGTKGSGVLFPPHNPLSLARFARDVREIQPNTIMPRTSFTISMWLRPYIAQSTSMSLIGGPVGDLVFPWTLNLSAMAPQIKLLMQGNTTETPNTTNKLIANNWAHVVFKSDFSRARHSIHISGQEQVGSALPFKNSGMWLTPMDATAAPISISFATLNMRRTGETGTEGYSGIMDEVLIFRDAIPSGEISNFYTQQSGFITEPGTPSGMLGGYLGASDTQYASGALGAYLVTGNTRSGILGGYFMAEPYNVSGRLGGYLYGFPATTGTIGAYVKGQTITSGHVGGWIRSKSLESGMLGAWMACVEDTPLDATFYAFFNVIGRDKNEVDALVRIIKAQNSEFDAVANIYTEEQKPDVSMISPAINQSGNTVPVTYTFEASASGYNGKRIYNTQWFFSDVPITSGSIITSSGTYRTSHTFSRSGLFDVIFLAVDEQGLVNSSRIIISTASGLTLPDVTLTSTLLSGIAPLTVGFSGVIANVPANIVDKFIYFGDGTYSPSTNNINKTYVIPGCYIPVFRVIDNRGVVVTDSLVINANN